MIRILFSLALCGCLYTQVSAQSIGIGAQFGRPTGITLRINNQSALGYDILAAWDFDDYFFLNVHGLWEHSLATGNPKLNYFYGPGLFGGFRERGRWEDDDAFVGLSGTIGLSLYIQKLELFAQVTPRIAVVPDTDGSVGGGVGLRFYVR